jgi:hypothetical protein
VKGKKLKRVLKWSLGVVVILLLVLIVLSQLKPVQNLVLQGFLSRIADQAQTEIKLGSIHWQKLGRLELEELLIRDQQADTLLAVDRIKIRLKPFQLFKRRIELEQVDVSGLLAKISGNDQQEWNYAFLLDAFGSETAEETEKKESVPWSIRAPSIQLNHIRLEYLDAFRQQELIAGWSQLILGMEELDLGRQFIDVNDFIIHQPELQYLAQATPPDTTASATSDVSGFPDLGWEIAIQRFSADEGLVTYQIGESKKPVAGVFDPASIRLQGLHWDIDSLNIDDQAMQASIRSFAFEDHSALQLRQLKTDLLFSDAELAIQNFDLRTAHSQIVHSMRVQYPSFAAFLQNLLQQANSHPGDIQLSLALKEARLSPHDLRFIAPGVLASDLTSPFLLQAMVDGNLSHLNIETISLQQGTTLSFQTSGNIDQPLDINDLGFNLRVHRLQLQSDSLFEVLAEPLLPTGLEKWGKLEVTGTLNGKLADLSLSAFQFRSDRGPKMAADLQLKGLPDYQNAVFRLNLNELQTKSGDWKALTANSLPAVLDSIGQLTLRGTANGNIHDFTTRLSMNTEAGDLNASAAINFTPDFSNASYNAQLYLNELQLDKLSGDAQFGTADLTAFINGEGLQSKDWNTTLTGHVHRLDYQDYVYDSLLYTAHLTNLDLKGNLRMEDPHLRFSADAKLPMDRGSGYELNFLLDTINLQPLRFTDTPLGISTELKVAFENLNPDSLQGRLALTDFIIENEAVYYQTDSLTLWSGLDKEGNQQLLINSDLLQLAFEGHYKWEDLPYSLFTFTNQYFPLAQAFFPEDSFRMLALDSTRFQARFTISDPTPLTKIILPELKTLDTFHLQLNFEGAEDQWELTANLPKFHYSDIRIDTLQIHSVANALRFQNQLNAKSLEMGANNRFFNPTITANLGDSTLRWKIESYKKPEYPIWQIGGQLISHNEAWQLQFDTSLVLEAQAWTIPPNHLAHFRWGDSWNIERLQFRQSASSFLQLDAQGSFVDSSGTALLAFQQFDIDILSPFLDYPPDYLGGTLNGKFSIADFLRKPDFSASLDLQEWTVDSVLIGNLSATARKMAGRPLIQVSSQLGGHVNELTILGQFDVNQQEFSSESTIQRLDLETLDPFLTGLIHDSKGFLSGDFSAEGKVNRPLVKGKLQFNDVTTTIDYVNTPYTFTEGKLSFTENQIKFENINMLDADGNAARLRGLISHQYFDDIAMDLNFNTDRFRFLNTTAKDNDLFYGRLILATDVNIKGPIGHPRFFINAKTQPNTNFYVVPLTDEQAISQEDFIIYGQPALDSMGRDTAYLNNYQVKAPGIDLRLNLEMTPDAAFEIIMDP